MIAVCRMRHRHRNVLGTTAGVEAAIVVRAAAISSDEDRECLCRCHGNRGPHERA